MKRTFTLIVFSLLSCCVVEAQINLGSGGSDDKSEKRVLNRSIERESVYLLTIGIKEFEDKCFEKLESADTIKLFETISKNYLRLSYAKHPKPTLLSNHVNKDAVIKSLESLCESVDSKSVVIISALSHGVIDITRDEYYFVCSNTNKNDLAETAISGSQLREFFKEMANKGALVLIFWDTCHAGALLGNSDYTPSSNGSITYFASSRKDQKSKEIFKRCKFTETIINFFLNKDNSIFDYNDMATIGSFKNFIKASLKTVISPQIQEPIAHSFSSDPNIDDVPVIKKKTFVPYGSIWKHPKPFSPLVISPDKSKWLDYGLIGVEGLSLIGMVVCGPVLQSYYKNKISEETNVFKRNDYRRKGKTASIGFCVSSGLLVSSYIARTLHVHHQLSLEHKERQFATLDITPVFSTDYNGLALVLNF